MPHDSIQGLGYVLREQPGRNWFQIQALPLGFVSLVSHLTPGMHSRLPQEKLLPRYVRLEVTSFCKWLLSLFLKNSESNAGLFCLPGKPRPRTVANDSPTPCLGPGPRSPKEKTDLVVSQTD